MRLTAPDNDVLTVVLRGNDAMCVRATRAKLACIPKTVGLQGAIRHMDVDFKFVTTSASSAS